MNICWQCATKLASPLPRRSIPRLILARSQRRHASGQNLSELINALPFPPPTVGDIRSRLAKWQKESGSTLTDPMSAEVETRKLQSFTRGSNDHLADESDDGAMFGDDMGEIGVQQMRHFVQPGSLVEITPLFSVKDPIFAVALAETNKRHVLLTINGRIVSVRQSHLLWHLPRWMDASKLAPLNPYLPKDESITEEDDIKVHDFGVPREASAPIITELNKFRNKINNIYRRHAAVLDKAHDILSDRVELQFGTISRIAQKLVGEYEKEITPEVLYTVRKALHRHPLGFNSLQTLQRRSQLWQVRPQNMVDDVLTARLWIRQYRDALSCNQSTDPRQAAKLRDTTGYKNVNEFVQMCRKEIAASRKIRACSKNGLSPDVTNAKFGASPRASRIFSVSQSLLIRFFQYWCIQEAFRQDQSLTGLPSFLLSSIGMYEEHTPGLLTGELLLKEIGCLPPYANSRILKPELMLPGHGLSARLDHIWNEIAKTPRSAVMKDSMMGLRHDWGDLPVICIDDEGTMDVDDGLSVEPVRGQEDQYWVRVHVANPTAFISAESNTSAMARQLTKTFYSPDEDIAMLPPVFRDICSLKAGAPTLTISFRVDRDGSVLEHDIRPGWVHNVHNLSYEKANKVLGLAGSQAKDFPEPLIVGASVDQMQQGLSGTQPNRQIDERVKADLQVLYRLSLALHIKREGEGAGNMEEHFNTSVKVFSPNDYPHRRSSISTLFQHKRSYDYRGDPVIQLQGSRHGPHHYLPRLGGMTSNHMVAEYMITAGATAASWSWDRKIPQPYRTQMVRVPEDEIRRFSKDVLTPAIAHKSYDQYTWEDALIGLRRREMFMPAFALPRPARHASLGVSQYLKVTSPLRRYSDMLAHWQIEAAIRHETSTGTSLITDDPSRPLPITFPFTREAIDTLLSRLIDRESIMTKAGNTAISHWTSTLFHRALYHPSPHQTQCAELTRGATFRVVTSSAQFTGMGGEQGIVLVRSETHDVKMFMRLDPNVHTETGGIRLFDVWEVMLDKVHMNGHQIVVQPVRLVQRVDEKAMKQYEIDRAAVAEISAKAPALV